ncbi:Sad1-interacting factor 3 [Marasmius tenuissimus]|uniref:Sad1-interacting factor 3 n=1 Tax=Marasmius tenuissimus TaxID=585030 RepID=A0ABR2ZZ77_9AGAR
MNPPRRDTTVPAPNPVPRRKRLKQRISSFNVPRKPSVGEGSSQTTTHAHTLRKGSISSAAGPKAQRTSKTSQKLVVLPEEPQTKPLPGSDEDLTLGYETDAGIRREHNVGPRVFDEALYVMYHLPLLPGYGPEANVRSSAPPKTSDGKSILNVLSEAEENGYQGSYFVHNNEQSQTPHHDGYLTSSPTDTRNNTTVTTPATPGTDTSASEAEAETDHYASASEAEGVNHEPYSNPDAQTMGSPPEPSTSFPIVSPPGQASQSPEKDDEHAEAVFFEYGVVVSSASRRFRRRASWKMCTMPG